MTCLRIAGVVLLVVLSAGLLTRITKRAGLQPKNPASLSLENPAVEGRPVIETVDLGNGNLHVKIPIRAARKKTAGPRSGH